MLPAIVTDIEGTTSRIDFVHQVLFPYARARISEFLHEHQQDPKVAAEIAAVRRTIAAPAVSLATVIQQLIDWIDQDRKVTELKTLQGMIWQHGFESSQFSAHVYPDAVECLGRWHQAGHSIYVYSSGSIAAQKLFFRYSVFGDLSALFSGYFDTTIGGKREPGSYLRIAEAIDQAPGAILFLSDLEAELDAAASAGLDTTQLIRADAPPESHGRHRVASNFREVILVPGRQLHDRPAGSGLG